MPSPSTGSASASEWLRFAEASGLVREIPGRAPWPEYCRARGIYHFPTREFVAALARFLRSRAAGPVLEIGAGNGLLADALAAEGIEVTATDPRVFPDIPYGPRVLTLNAQEALRRFPWPTVILCWPPIDCRLDEWVLAQPRVERLVLIDQMNLGVVGSPQLWERPDLRATRLEEADRYSLCRLDYLADFDHGPLVRHSFAVCFERL